MSANRPDAKSSEAILDLQLMGILQKLNAAEMHLLSAFFNVGFCVVGRTNIFNALADQVGYSSETLIRRNAEALTQEGFIDRLGEIRAVTWEPPRIC